MSDNAPKKSISLKAVAHMVVYANRAKKTQEEAAANRRRVQNALHCFYVSSFMWKFGYGVFYTTRVQMQADAFGGYAESAASVAWFDGGNQIIDFLFSPLWGVVGDKIGKKPLVVLFAAQKALPIVCMALGAPFWTFLTIDNLIPLPGSISGGVAGAYIADLLVADHEDEADEEEGPKKKKVINPATAFAYYQASMFFGEAMGTMAGPFVEDHFGSGQCVIIAAACCYVLNVVWAMLALPESLQRHHKESNEGDANKSMISELIKEGNPVGAVRLISSIGPMVVAYVMLMMTLSCVSQGIDSVKDQYVAIRMGVTGKKLALVHVYMAIMMVVGNMVLTPFLTKKFGQRRTTYIGIMLSICGLLLLAAMSSLDGAFLAFGCFSLGSVWSPAIQGSIARATPPAKQGSMQSALAALLALGMAIAPLPFAHLFKSTQVSAPYVVCLLGAALVLIVVALTFRNIFWSDAKQRYHTIFHKTKLKINKDAAARETCDDEIPYEILE